MHSCYICGGEKFIRRPGKVRDNASLEAMECIDCGLVFLSSFSHITEGFYGNSGMHAGEVDREKWSKETAWDDERRFYTLRWVIENKSVLDFGCGNGGFLLNAKEVARSVAGIEPENCLKTYFRTEGLEVFSSIEDAADSFDVITMFHVLEHIPDPRTILKKLCEKLNDGGQLIVEVPNADDALLKLYQCEPFSNFTYWSCHLFLFTPSTLTALAKQAGLVINYIKQVQRYPLSNHLYWLAKGKPGGHQRWGFLDSPELHDCYEKQLASIGACDTIFASFSRGVI